MKTLSVKQLSRIKKYMVFNMVAPNKCKKCGMKYYSGTFPMPPPNKMPIGLSDKCECGEQISFGVRVL